MTLVKVSVKGAPIEPGEYDAVVDQVLENKDLAEANAAAIPSVSQAVGLFYAANEAEMTAEWNRRDGLGDTPIDGKAEVIRKDFTPYQYWEWKSSEASKGVYSGRDVVEIAEDGSTFIDSEKLHKGKDIENRIDEKISPLNLAIQAKIKYEFSNPTPIVVTRLLQFDATLDIVGNYTGNKVDTIENNLFENDAFAIADTGKSYKLIDWRANGYSSWAGVSKTLNFDISGYSVGDKVFVHFIMKREALGGAVDGNAKRVLIIGSNEVTLTVANSDTTITDLGDGYNLYATEYELTSADITHGTIDTFQLTYYASSNRLNDSLEVLAYEIYLASESLYSSSFNNKIDDVEQKTIDNLDEININKSRLDVLEGSIASLDGKVISNSIQGIDFVGNYTPPFITQETKIASKISALKDLDVNTPVYIGTGYKTTVSYGSYAGLRLDINKDLSDFSAVEGDVLNLLFYMKKVDVGTHSSQGFFIGSNEIEVHTGSHVTVTALTDSWEKFEISHTLTASDITENTISHFLVQGWNSTNDVTRLTQSIQLVEPLIWLNNIDIDDKLDDVSRLLLDAKIDDLATDTLTQQNLVLRVEANSIGNYNAWQPILKERLRLSEIRNFCVPGRHLGQAFTELTTGDLDDVNVVLFSLGINDYLGNATLGTIADDYTIDSVYGRVRKAIKTAHEENVWTRLGFITPLPTKNNFGGGAVYNGVNGQGYTPVDVADAIIDVCKEESIPVLDMTRASGVSSYNIDTISTDGIHPTANDYQYLKTTYADKVSDFVMTIIGR